MHELGLLDAVIKTVDGIMAGESDVKGVSRITLEVGKLSGVIPRYLYDCWEAVRDGTKYAETALNVITVPGKASCGDCGAVFAVDSADLRCPECGGSKLTPISGRDMTISEIEAY